MFRPSLDLVITVQCFRQQINSISKRTLSMLSHHEGIAFFLARPAKVFVHSSIIFRNALREFVRSCFYFTQRNLVLIRTCWRVREAVKGVKMIFDAL